MKLVCSTWTLETVNQLIDCSFSVTNPLKPQLNNDYLFQFSFIWMEYLFVSFEKIRLGSLGAHQFLAYEI